MQHQLGSVRLVLFIPHCFGAEFQKCGYFQWVVTQLTQRIEQIFLKINLDEFHSEEQWNAQSVMRS